MGFGGNAFFDHESIRKYIIIFGRLFSDLSVERSDANGVRQQTLPVPLAYGPREKWLSRLNVDSDLGREVAIQLPRMGFEILGITYAPERAKGAIQRNVAVSTSDSQKLKNQYVGVPYDFEISLSIMVKNANDGAQILQQILPFFTPDWTISANMIPEMGFKTDIPIILTSVATEDQYDGDFDPRRALIWTLDFQVKGYLYGPVKTDEIIKKVTTDFFIPTPVANTFIQDSDIGTTATASRIETTPGLLADGTATTNSTASVAYTTIDANDDYGFAQDLFFYSDGTIHE
jgi:hypothetical protein